ncbi:MAG: GNAT family N-acetyltransferase [Acidiferrobacterales bacterium]|jgi:ribosomal protein S18 acetylase RimI-like enzyme|nr:GNAT family N-acetyltransferase [Acidiferrobacterales bacterium]
MSKQTTNIRPLREADLDAVMKLHRELGWNPAFRADGSTLRQRLSALINEENALLLVAERERDVVGYIHGEIVTYLLFAGSEMLISEVFVMAAARGQGVGRALIETMEAEAVKQRCFRISVLNSRERESYKRGFYPSLGYEERASTAVFHKRLDWG